MVIETYILRLQKLYNLLQVRKLMTQINIKLARFLTVLTRVEKNFESREGMFGQHFVTRSFPHSLRPHMS